MIKNVQQFPNFWSTCVAFGYNSKMTAVLKSGIGASFIVTYPFFKGVRVSNRYVQFIDFRTTYACTY